MEKPVIFIFTTSYLPFIGGVEIAIQEITQRLAGDFDFFIFTARFKRSLPSEELRPEGKVFRLGLGTKFDKWLLLILGPWAAMRQRRKLSRPRIIIWGVDISAGAIASAFLKFLWPGTPFVFNIQYGEGESRISRGRFGLIGFSFRFILNRADAVTAISSYLAELARRFGRREDVTVIPNGVDLESFEPAVRPHFQVNPKVIISVSRLVRKNGLDILIRALAEIKARGRGAVCHIVGEGPERQTLEKLARSFGLSEEIVFFGGVPPERVPFYLSRAGVFVRPSRSEGMGNAFIEALAAGLPIIGTPVGGITDIIKEGQTGLLARVDDPKDLADKILKLFDDQPLVQHIVSTGQAMVREHFSWAKISDSYGKIFLRLLSIQPRLLIATPQFPPDLGGPGSYAQNLAEYFLAKGCGVTILSYGSNRNLTRLNLVNVSHSRPSGLKHFVYFLKALQLLLKSDVALILDSVIVGFPAALACRLLSKPMIIRVEGDFLWEWHSERTKSDLTLRQFYEQLKKQHLSLKERLMYKLARFVFSQAGYLVFSSQWRKEIFKLGYQLKPERTAFITSPWPEVGAGKIDREKIILFAGRFIHIKNLKRLICAFSAVAPADFRLELIGQGPEQKNLEFIIHNLKLRDRVVIRPPLKKEELLKRIASAHAFLLPSLSDVSPNVILDCLAVGTPFILTQESGFYETLKDIGVFVDPLDEKDIGDKLRLLLDQEFYAAYRQRLKNFKKHHSWDETADEWLSLIRNIL